MTAAVAQQTSSPYSRFGYGLLRDNATSAQRQMGGIGYAMTSGRQINAMNPASYSRIDSLTFLFDMGVDASFINSKEEGSSLSQKGGGLDYVTMQFPLSKRIGASVGLLPYSSVGYAFGSEIKNGTNSHQGSGGLNQLYVGLSGNIFKGFSAGFNFSYLFGNNINDIYAYTATGSTSLFEQEIEVLEKYERAQTDDERYYQEQSAHAFALRFRHEKPRAVRNNGSTEDQEYKPYVPTHICVIRRGKQPRPTDFVRKQKINDDDYRQKNKKLQ